MNYKTVLDRIIAAAEEGKDLSALRLDLKEALEIVEHKLYTNAKGGKQS